jgi:hypothetical protein
VVTASTDRSARVWEASTGKAVGEPMQHNNDVLLAAFGPDGKWVVTASSDYTARVWEAPLEVPLSEQLISVAKLLPPLIGHLDFDANGFLKSVPTPRVTEYRDQISIALKHPGIRAVMRSEVLKTLSIVCFRPKTFPADVARDIHHDCFWRKRSGGFGGNSQFVNRQSHIWPDAETVRI